MELFCKNVEGLNSLTIIAYISVLDVCQGSNYVVIDS